jgi:chemotaxis protein MotB
MDRRITKRSLPALVVGCVLLASGCATQQQMREYQDEVRGLREERTQLKKENASLRRQAESYEVALAEASQKLTEVPEARAYAELDDLGIEYGNRGGNFVISIPAAITFGPGKAELTKEGRQALAAVAKTLLTDYASGTYWIEGHTDSDPIKKSSWGSNRELSVARAMAVLHYLVEETALNDESCVVAGHGEYDPIASNADNGGKARNRRVEIVVHG